MHPNQTHGHSRVNQRTTTYRAWDSMIQRCYNPNDKSYSNYGAKGITVDSSWLSFSNFLLDMGSSPPNRSLDRIDGSKNYVVSNCRWATIFVQNNNTARNIRFDYLGVNKTLAQWADETGIPYKTLYSRISRQWSIAKAIETPVRKRRKT